MSYVYSKSHNKTVLLYHMVFSIKYRRKVLSESVTATIVRQCVEMEDKYEFNFIEIGCDGDHIHLLVQSKPTKTVSDIVRTIKSITARNVFQYNPEVKKQLWGGEFWSDGYWAVTVGRSSTENVIREYVRNQGYDRYDLLLKREFESDI